jgi:hypothetical protein
MRRVPVRRYDSALRLALVGSENGTGIIGGFQGEGPPLVLVHGPMNDGTLLALP